MQLNFRENNLYEIFIRSKKTVCYMSVCVKWVSRFHCIRLSRFKLLKTRGRCLQLEEQNSVTNKKPNSDVHGDMKSVYISFCNKLLL